MGTNEQLLRIALNAVGSAVLGASVAQGAEFQAAIGGVVALVSFGWWYFRNRQAKK